MAFASSLVRQLIQLTGFGTVEFRECAPIPHGLKSSIRFEARQGIRQLIKAYLLVEKASTRSLYVRHDLPSDDEQCAENRKKRSAPA